MHDRLDLISGTSSWFEYCQVVKSQQQPTLPWITPPTIAEQRDIEQQLDDFWAHRPTNKGLHLPGLEQAHTQLLVGSTSQLPTLRAPPGGSPAVTVDRQSNRETRSRSLSNYDSGSSSSSDEESLQSNADLARKRTTFHKSKMM